MKSKLIHEIDNIEILNLIDWKRDFKIPIKNFLNYNNDQFFEIKKTKIISATDLNIHDKKNMLNYKKFEKIYYYQVGSQQFKENKPICWEFIIKHSNGMYIYFCLNCEFPGMEIDAFANVTFSTDLDDLINFGLSRQTRNNIKNFSSENLLIVLEKKSQNSKVNIDHIDHIDHIDGMENNDVDNIDNINNMNKMDNDTSSIIPTLGLLIITAFVYSFLYK